MQHKDLRTEIAPEFTSHFLYITPKFLCLPLQQSKMLFLHPTDIELYDPYNIKNKASTSMQNCDAT